MNSTVGNTAVTLLAGALLAATIAPIATPVETPQARRIAVRLVDNATPDIVIDFVRHGQTADGNNGDIAGTVLPGHPLSTLGQQEAADVGNSLYQQLGGPDGVAGIFVGQNQRMPETAAPFADLEHMQPTTLSGLNEIGGGIYSHAPPDSPGWFLYLLTVAEWVAGARLAPLPGSNDYIGTQFDNDANEAVDTMYADAMTNPVVSADGHITDVAFSGEGTISDWVLMNVKNPDLAILLPEIVQAAGSGTLLSESGQVVVEGSPDDGWTLVSFDGQSVPADPGLLTELAVDLRAAFTAPQQALWNLLEAALTGDTADLGTAVQTALTDIAQAVEQFPQSVVADVSDEFQNLTDDLNSGASFSDAFGSAIIGLS